MSKSNIDKNLGSVNVQEFGAIGDGIADDTSAIQKAINAASILGGNVIVPPGTYSTSATLVVKPRVKLVLSKSAQIKPTGDFHIIRLIKDGQITGGETYTKHLPSFSSAHIWLEGSDKFSTNNHITSISSINLRALGNKAIGIYFHASGDGHNICWVHTNDVNMDYMYKGIFLSCPWDPTTTGGQWVNGNQFDNIGITSSTYGIYLDGSAALGPAGTFYETSGNNFSNIQMQALQTTQEPTPVYELETLNITSGCTADGNVSISLDNKLFTVALTAADNTATLVATKIRNATYSGWTTGGTGATITFTNTTYGSKSVPVYSAGSTGATGTMSITSLGVPSGTRYFHISGMYNTISGMFWDPQMISSNAKATLVSTAFDTIIDSNLTYSQILDLGTRNLIRGTQPNPIMQNGFMLPPTTEGMESFAGSQDNMLSFADKRFDVKQINGPTISNGSLSNMFNLIGDSWVRWDANPSNGGAANSSGNAVVIEIQFATRYTYMRNIGVSFGPWSESPTDFKLERIYDGASTVLLNLTGLGPQKFIVYTGAVTYVDKLRFTFFGTNDTTNYRLVVYNMFAQSASTVPASYLTGNGGQLYGDLNIGNNYLTVGSISSLPTAAATYRNNLAIVQGAKTGAQVVNLYITDKAYLNSNATVTLDGTPYNIPLVASSDNNPTAVANKIAVTSFTGWTTSVLTSNTSRSASVTFTSASNGARTTSTYSPGSTGATGIMTVTTSGASTSTADKLYVCQKLADDTYRWSQVESNIILQSVSDMKLTTTSATTIASYTPTVQANFEVKVYYRVITTPTTVSIIVTYTDGTGAQTQTIVSATNQPIGSYSTVPVTINATSASAITVTATAGTANLVYVSSTIKAE